MSSDLGIEALLGRKFYANGWARPALRGLLHGLSTIFLLPALITCVLALAVGALPWPWWRLASLLLAKFASCFASSMLHLCPHKSEPEMRAWMKADMVTLCFAVWAPTSAFLADLGHWLAQFCLVCCVAAATYLLSDLEAGSSEASLRTLDGRRSMRTALNMAFFVWCLLLIGWQNGFDGLWIGGALSYGAATAVSPPFYRK